MLSKFSVKKPYTVVVGVVLIIIRCFAPPNRYLQVKSLISSAIADFFCVKIYVFYCCIILRFT